MSITIHPPNQNSKLALPNVGDQIVAGFPSPAEDYLEVMLDLNKALIKNSSATFYGRVKGASMKDAGVDSGDLLVIDKSLTYRNNALAVCFINGEFTLKRIKKEGDTIVGLRIKKELEGISCLAMELIPPVKKAICTSRSFGTSQTDLEPIKEAVATYTARCAAKLRKLRSCAGMLMVFIHTNGFMTN